MRRESNSEGHVKFASVRKKDLFPSQKFDIIWRKSVKIIKNLVCIERKAAVECGEHHQHGAEPRRRSLAAGFSLSDVYFLLYLF